MINKKIKLIIVDFYGVMSLGSYRETCQYLANKYKLNYNYIYKIIYHKYFSQAALGKISEKESFKLPIKELELNETWRGLRTKHLLFQKLNKPVFKLCLKLQDRGYTILLLSKNTPSQFRYALRKMHIRKYFKQIINTYDLKLPKESRATITYILKKFRIKASVVIMVDDQNFNLFAARKLGVNTILYNDFKDLKFRLSRYLA